MLLLSLAFLPSFLTPALGIPTPLPRNITAESWQPATRSLTATDSSDLTATRQLLPRPPAPYLYQIVDEPDLFIRFDIFGQAVSRADGDILMYQAILSLDADIRIDPEHEEGPWHPRPFWKVVDHHFALIMLDAEQSLTNLGDIWYCVRGLSQFMRQYGFCECQFRLFERNSSGHGFYLLAAGALERQ
ncbi:hypothetical protein XPA_004671 [Xanthoria parietina]